MTDPLIESDAFPFEFISALAERESWRKEIYRPVYHLHKWWAKRLGSVFRGIVLGAALPADADLASAFYQALDFNGLTVFDPFMGSGTTLGEAHKLGCTAVGRDINPVACESVRVALGELDKAALHQAFHQLQQSIGHELQDLYRAWDAYGQACEVLYYFWVKRVPCLHCGHDTDLFPDYILARNAYPGRKPDIQVFCPHCAHIFPALYPEQSVTCPQCQAEFNPHQGNAPRANAYCTSCQQEFSIVKAVRAFGHAPAHRLYAKLLLTPQGNKVYAPTDEADWDAYRACSEQLARELANGTIVLPDAVLENGYNTRQAINYNYRNWRDFFNDRQLLALGKLQRAIAELPDSTSRDALLLLFSGVLEFNNLFASYKGEGTGAVRHMFSHHILRPEKRPIEANIWGTSKSSGAFSTLFKSRLLRALEYRAAPFEVGLRGTAKGRQVGLAFSGKVRTDTPQRIASSCAVYLSCGSSDHTELLDRSVDRIITDPPFFDNVHYSELADFFHAWQSLYPHGFIRPGPTTRHLCEVQDTVADSFTTKLRAVFTECRRVLKDEGLLIFTYHHSRSEGWTSLTRAVLGAGFSIMNAHPVKAEMSVATPKSQAREPIQVDIILVCRKQEQDRRDVRHAEVALKDAVARTREKLLRLKNIGLNLSLNDHRVTLVSQFIVALGPVNSEMVVKLLADHNQAINAELLENKKKWLAEESRADEAPADLPQRRNTSRRQLSLKFDS